jgi:hypothetical protein
MSATNYLEDKVLDHVLGNTAFTQPSLYVALLNGVTDAEAGTVTECTGGGYARQSASFGAASGGSCSTDADIQYPAATDGAWGTITHAAIYDALTGGNPLFVGALTASKTVTQSDVFQISSGNLTITLD